MKNRSYVPQIVPHITNAIQDWIERVSKILVDESGEEPDVCMVELGGTVGDIESAPFVEAMRQFQFRVGHDNFALIHVSLVPDMHGEQKTKPTQTTVHSLRGLGLLPDLVRTLPFTCSAVLMSSDCVPSSCATTTEPRNKRQDLHVLSPSEQVFGVYHVTSVYHVPFLLQSQGIVEFPRKRLKLENVNITKGMEDKGKSLGKRWKDITVGYVSSLTVANSDQMHTLGRRSCLTPSLLHLSENTPT